MRRTAIPLSKVLLAAAPLCAQSGVRSASGTVAALKPEQAAFDLRLDAGGAETVKLSQNTVVQRVAPGEKDLRNARPVPATGLAAGDRVLGELGERHGRGPPRGGDGRR